MSKHQIITDWLGYLITSDEFVSKVNSFPTIITDKSIIVELA